MARFFSLLAAVLLAVSTIAPIAVVIGSPAPQDATDVTPTQASGDVQTPDDAPVAAPAETGGGVQVPQGAPVAAPAQTGVGVPQQAPGVPQQAPDGTQAQTGGFCRFIGSLPGSTVKPTGVQLPPAIRVSPTEGKFYLRLFARGTQNYRCDVNRGWTFVEPRALLFNSARQKNAIGRHFFLGRPDARGGQAVWAGANVRNCGAVVTKKIAEARSTNPRRNIPWLKTATTSTAGAANGILSRATFVLRVLTNGGQPPARADCGRRFRNGQIFKSPYTAEYWYYRRP